MAMDSPETTATPLTAILLLLLPFLSSPSSSPASDIVPLQPKMDSKSYYSIVRIPSVSYKENCSVGC